MFPDVMFVKDFIPKIINNIKNCKTDCPVICIRQPMEGFQNILVKDENILEEIIRHFIVHHKFTKLNFLTGRLRIRHPYTGSIHTKGPYGVWHSDRRRQDKIR